MDGELLNMNHTATAGALLLLVDTSEFGSDRS